jgi:hypothetical protein
MSNLGVLTAACGTGSIESQLVDIVRVFAVKVDQVEA